ncbi:membrane lipoprotein lipid attachment site-containing protein [Bacillus massilinigeriensis]|uniref:membrane lipoprotein lipid attachment site-containing protein n=1 Tax=Bacillus massilionigeriensis TaxID=1805475 RepID=UPI00096B1983|nr:membrane lipoprotein lipid attachment site-containing protein [Bacillus massilionigeriensis]
MKKIIFLLCIISLLTACSAKKEKKIFQNEATQVKSEQGEEEGQTALKNSSENMKLNFGAHAPSPQVSDDQLLQKVGTSITDSKGKLTLRAMNDSNIIEKIGPIKLEIKEIKMMNYRPDYSLIDFFHFYTHDEEFDLLKVKVELQNTSDHPVMFNPLAYLSIGNEKKSWLDDVYLEELNGVINGGEVRSGNIGFIVNWEDVNEVKIITSDALDEAKKVISKGKNISLKL